MLWVMSEIGTLAPGEENENGASHSLTLLVTMQVKTQMNN